jgi:hypothetical protein
MSLSFDTRNYLTPAGPTSSTLKEMYDVFVKGIPTPKRKELWDAFNEWLHQLKSLVRNAPLKLWVNGSFVTGKQEPNDVDVVVFLEEGLMAAHSIQLAAFFGRSKSDFGVDCYHVVSCVASSPGHSNYQADTAYWTTLFSSTRPNRLGYRHSKGYLEIIP